VNRRLIVCACALTFAGLSAAEVRAAEPPADAASVTGAAPIRPNRSGFTLEVGVGGALTVVNDDVADFSFSSNGPSMESVHTRTRAWGGVAPLSISIGGFVTERVALLFRASGTAYFKYSANDAYTNSFYGPAVQVWANDRFMWSAGLGLGLHGESPLTGTGGMDLGLAASLRAGYAFFLSDWHLARVGLELVPGVFDGTRTLGAAATLDWQLL
jgi:hypothetical protein